MLWRTSFSEHDGVADTTRFASLFRDEVLSDHVFGVLASFLGTVHMSRSNDTNRRTSASAPVDHVHAAL